MRSCGFNILVAGKIGALNQDRYRAALGEVRRLPSIIAIPKH
jgi:hypothetical protein